MAQLTGIPEIDDALDGFYREPVEDEDGVEIPHEMFTDPDASAGLCVAASEAACAMLERLGLDARVVDGRREDVAHTWVEITHDGQVFRIDFTAAQFGREEYPLIERQGASGQWHEQWDQHAPITLERLAHDTPITWHDDEIAPFPPPDTDRTQWHAARVRGAGGNTLGYAAWRLYGGDDAYLWLSSLWVDPEQCGQGVASAVIKQLAAEHPGLPFDAEVHDESGAMKLALSHAPKLPPVMETLDALPATPAATASLSRDGQAQ